MKTVLSILKKITYYFTSISKNETHYRNSINFSVDKLYRRIKNIENNHIDNSISDINTIYTVSRLSNADYQVMKMANIVVFFCSKRWCDDANDDINFDKSNEFVMTKKWRSVSDSPEDENTIS